MMIVKPLFSDSALTHSIPQFSSLQSTPRHWTVELVDHTYDGRCVARRTHTSVDRNALTALLRFRVGLVVDLVPAIVQQLTRFCLI